MPADTVLAGILNTLKTLAAQNISYKCNWWKQSKAITVLTQHILTLLT